MIDCTGTDASLYSLKGLVTGEKFYPTIETLRAAFDAGELAMEYDDVGRRLGACGLQAGAW